MLGYHGSNRAAVPEEHGVEMFSLCCNPSCAVQTQSWQQQKLSQGGACCTQYRVGAVPYRTVRYSAASQLVSQPAASIWQDCLHMHKPHLIRHIRLHHGFDWLHMPAFCLPPLLCAVCPWRRCYASSRTAPQPRQHMLTRTVYRLQPVQGSAAAIVWSA